MKNRYRNPWAKLTNRQGPEYFEHDCPRVGTFRGVDVFRNPAGAFDYVLQGCAIACRGAFSPETVDELLDGRQCVCDAVAAHLRACGHIALTYSEASAIDQCERDGYPVPARTSPDFVRMVAHYNRAA